MALPGHHSEDEQQDPDRRTPPPKDKYHLYHWPGESLKEDYDRTRDELRQARVVIENYDRELRRRNAELHKASHYIGQLQHDKLQSKDSINGLQNELMNVHQQLKKTKTFSNVSGPQVFSTKADTLSISEVGEKVIALNKEVFRAATTLGKALIHKRRKLFETDLDAAAAVHVSQEMVGKKMTNILITQSQNPVNPLLVQVVLQIFLVKFCVSKIQSWYPNDSAIGGFLSAVYSEIRSTGKHCIASDSKPSFA